MIQNPYLYGYLIKDDGFLNLPSFGLVKAEGFTLSELENIIKQIAVSYFEQPVVKLNIINFEISILGEVNHPGTFKIVDPDVNILYALSLALKQSTEPACWTEAGSLFQNLTTLPERKSYLVE